MAGLSTACLYSVVKNTSGQSKTFGFLPPHGRQLDINEEFTVFGDVRQAMIRFERTEGRRNIESFEAALRRGDLEIISTPAVILEDDSNPGSTKALRLSNGTLGITDVCWNTSVSLDTESGG
jgi:hypothetical protein